MSALITLLIAALIFFIMLWHIKVEEMDKEKEIRETYKEEKKEIVVVKKTFKEILDAEIIKLTLNPKAVDNGYWVKLHMNDMSCMWRDTEINTSRNFKDHIPFTTKMVVGHHINSIPFELELPITLLK